MLIVRTRVRGTEVTVPLEVELVSADSRVWSGEAREVIARTTEGDLGVLPGHAPVLAVLAKGEVRIFTEGEEVVATVDDGFLSIEHNRVTVVSDSARLAGSDAG
jgi:F-type H+-transporting ATPase subunit epsilon